MRCPVLLLLDSQGGDNSLVKMWFEKSRFQTAQFEDVFQVLEELSDFTVRRSPDVIILEVASFLNNFSSVAEIIQTLPADSKVPIFSSSEFGSFSDFDGSFKGDLNQLNIELEKIIPQNRNHFVAN
jgi:hypothetical protein